MYIKVNVIDLVISWVKKHDQGSTCLAQSASGPVLQSLGLDAAPRTADRLSHQTRTYKQTSAKDKKQYTKQQEQYKTRLLNYSTHCKDRVGARIVKNGFKTRKL